jgi:hypothetical protein
VLSPEPPQIGPSMVSVTLAEAGGQLIQGAEVELEANMSHAGMVPVFTTALEVAPGRYEAALEFTMGAPRRYKGTVDTAVRLLSTATGYVRQP